MLPGTKGAGAGLWAYESAYSSGDPIVDFSLRRASDDSARASLESTRASRASLESQRGQSLEFPRGASWASFESLRGPSRGSLESQRGPSLDFPRGASYASLESHHGPSRLSVESQRGPSRGSLELQRGPMRGLLESQRGPSLDIPRGASWASFESQQGPSRASIDLQNTDRTSLDSRRGKEVVVGGPGGRWSPSRHMPLCSRALPQSKARGI